MLGPCGVPEVARGLSSLPPEPPFRRGERIPSRTCAHPPKGLRAPAPSRRPMWQTSERQRKIAAILRKLREAAAEGLDILYEETVIKIMANLGPSRKTAREYLSVIAAQGHIRIDTQENRIYVVIPVETEEEPDEGQ